MKKGILLTVSIFLAVSVTNLNAQDKSWAQFRGPNENGISSETGINKDWKKHPPKVLWELKMTDNGHSIPAIADGKVFVIDHDGDTDIIKALDLNTGKEIWKYEYKDAKKQKWGFTRVMPIYHEGKVITLSRMGKLICFDAEKGKIKWRRDFIKDFNGKLPRWGFSGTPVIDGDKLIVSPLGAGSMIAKLDINSGKTVWKGGGDIDPGHSTPSIVTIKGVKQYLFANRFGLAGISAADGKVLWKVPFETKWGNNIAVPVLFNKNHVLITAGYNHGCATFKVTGDKAEKVWENGVLKSHFNSPVLIDNLIYGIGDPGKLVCLDPATGKVRWEKRGFGKGGLIVIDGTIIAIDGKSGKVILAELNPEKYVELGRIAPLPKDTLSWVPPIVADKKLVVRNRTKLVCLDISKPTAKAKAKAKKQKPQINTEGH